MLVLVLLGSNWGCAPASGDLSEADVREIRARAEAGDLEALFQIGQIYQHGDTVSASAEQAAEWYRAAAERDYGLAQFALGYLYIEGEGVEQNREKAMELFEKAALKGDEVAQFNLGILYVEEGDGQDFGEALKWFRAASFQGDMDALHALGVMYEQGDGVLQSDAEAYKFYKRSAEEDHPGGMYSLGSFYESGQVVEQDFEKAIYWYRKALDDDGFEGSAQGSNDLAWLYATCREAELRDGRRAAKYALKATAEDPEDFYYHDTLAAAYARSGWFEDATVAMEWAIGLVEAQEGLDEDERGELLGDFRGRLGLYRRGEAYVDSGE